MAGTVLSTPPTLTSCKEVVSSSNLDVKDDVEDNKVEDFPYSYVKK